MRKEFNLTMTRIHKEIQQMSRLESDQLYARPLDNDIFTWHFTVSGPKDSEFEGGYYHGRIMLPAEYPLFAPSIIFINHSGRFEVQSPICFTNTSYHPEQWNTMWNIRLILQSVRQIFIEKEDGLGHIETSKQHRKKLALASKQFVCQQCGPIAKHLAQPEPEKKQEVQQKVQVQPSEPVEEKKQPLKREKAQFQFKPRLQKALLRIDEMKRVLESAKIKVPGEK